MDRIVLKLEYNYGLCDKTEVRNKIKKLLSKWEVYIKVLCIRKIS